MVERTKQFLEKSVLPCRVSRRRRASGALARGPSPCGDMLHFHQLHCPLAPGSSGPYLRKGLVHCSVPRRTPTGLSTSSSRTVRISWDGRSLGKNSRPWVFYRIVIEPNHEELAPALRKAFQTQTLTSRGKQPGNRIKLDAWGSIHLECGLFCTGQPLCTPSAAPPSTA